MEDIDDIIYNLLKYSTDLSKELLSQLDEFYPVCFYYKKGIYKSLAIADWKGSAKEYGFKLRELLSSNQINIFTIATDTFIKKDLNERESAIEIYTVYNGVEYEKSYIFYIRDKKGNYFFSELTYLHRGTL